MLTRRALASTGWSKTGSLEITTAANGRDALDQLGAAIDSGTLPDLVLLDINMPVMDGMTMLSRCREDPLLRLLSIVVVTTSSDRETHRQAMALGASAVHAKPSDAQGMRAIMASIMEMHELD